VPSGFLAIWRWVLNARSFVSALFVFGAILAACGGGGSGSGGPGPPNTSSPSPAASSFEVAAGGSALKLGPIGDIEGVSLQFPTVSSGAGATVTYALSQAAPPDDPELALRRLTQSGAQGLWFFTFSTNSAVAFDAAPESTFTLESIASNVQYDLALYSSNTGSWTEPWEGPAAIEGSAISFSPPAGSFSISPGVTYIIALYTVSTSTSSPSASPSASPSTSPSASPSASPSSKPTASVSPSASPSSSPSPAALSASPNPLNAGETGALTLYVTEQGYSGVYTLASDDTSVATVPGTVNATDPKTAITVTAVNAGTAHVKITDSHGQAVTVTVVVTTTPVTISLLPIEQGWKGR
jgi:hypothetical protein